MSTALENREFETSLSNSALGLLFTVGRRLGDVVEDAAKTLARNRGSFVDGRPNLIAVEEDDVREAARLIIAAFEKLAETGLVDPAALKEAASRIESYHEDE